MVFYLGLLLVKEFSRFPNQPKNDSKLIVKMLNDKNVQVS